MPITKCDFARNGAILAAIATIVAVGAQKVDAQTTVNAECDIQLNGIDLITGSCMVVEKDGELQISSAALQSDNTSGLPKARVNLLLSDNKKDVILATYNTDNMSRFADISLNGLKANLSERGGCIETGSLNLCYRMDAGAATQTNIRDVFDAASTEQRKSMQGVLKEFGYYQENIDGAWGENTERALMALDEIGQVAQLMDETYYRANFDEVGLKRFLSDLQTTDTLKIMEVYSFCDNMDGNLLNVREGNGDAYTNQVTEAYATTADKWCSSLFVEVE